MQDLTPKQIVTRLDQHIVGQADAKRAVAVAVRNRWRRQQLEDEMREEVAPKNILMRGPTGVGKTEIARRLAALTGAPFIKVEASKYTEVGYYGRDVESMIRELVENAIDLIQRRERQNVEEQANERVEDRLLDLLIPMPAGGMGMSTTHVGAGEPSQENDRTREIMREMLQAGQLEERKVQVQIEKKSMPMMLGAMGTGMDQMDSELQGMFEKIIPRDVSSQEMSVAEARGVIFEQECEALINREKVQAEAVELAQNTGIIFIDEIDKVVASEKMQGADVSREGVQRDLLPIVEGTTVQTRYGYVRTDHILFIAAGAFHRSRPNDLMPELQGRFPIRVDLDDLTKDDFVRILTEPTGALTKQYKALMATEKIDLEFASDAIEALAQYAHQVNQSTQNIGARRLYTIMERMLEELSFEASDLGGERIVIDANYVSKRLEEVAGKEDLSRFIL